MESINNSRSRDGQAIRRKVMGDAYVDAALERADEFTRPLQDYITEFCWGAVWTRQGIDHKTRSLVTLAILAATGKTEELVGHTRGALRNGCTVSEIQEVFLHVGVYAGAPSAIAAFRAGQPVVAEARSAE